MAGLKESILSLLAKCETIEGIAYVRIWNNQLNYEVEGQLYDFPKPAIFVEAQIPNMFLPLGGGYSQSDIFFNIHIVHEQFDAGGGTFEQNLAIYDLRAKVINALNIFKPAMCSPLMKWSEQQDYEHNNLYHYQIQFLCGLIDDAGVNTGNQITKNPPTGLTIQALIQKSIINQPSENYRKVWHVQ
jgi:hypothetical protein